MKTGFTSVLKKNVRPWAFVITCLLFVSIVVTAKVMADAVIAVCDGTPL